jgi:chromosomal replication initiation ATPase DnaA
MVSDDAHWPSGKLALTGPSGSGKTHLVQVWASETGAEVVSASRICQADIPALAAHHRVAVEDIEALVGDADGEAALFHLHNLLLAGGGRLLVTGVSPPARWRIALPDLASRLQGTTVAEMAAPDDALLSAVLVKLLADRQIVAAPTLVSYLASRIDRSLDAARDIVALLDQAALSEGRPVTRALAARLLDKDAPRGA